MPSRMHARRGTEGGGGGGCVAATLLGLSTCDAAAIKIHSCRGARRERQAGRQARQEAWHWGAWHVKWPGCVRAAL